MKKRLMIAGCIVVSAALAFVLFLISVVYITTPPNLDNFDPAAANILAEVAKIEHVKLDGLLLDGLTRSALEQSNTAYPFRKAPLLPPYGGFYRFDRFKKGSCIAAAVRDYPVLSGSIDGGMRSRRRQRVSGAFQKTRQTLLVFDE